MAKMVEAATLPKTWKTGEMKQNLGVAMSHFHTAVHID